MTWFRVGGAGIPASLKNAMNAVFNKKFGTIGQNYPSNGWPDDVNLMGPLPEGTASGSISHIVDVADQVPIKLWNCTVDNTDGVSSVSCTKSGKNLLNPTYLQDGYSLGANGLPVPTAKRIATTTPVPIHGGNITISYSTSVNTVQFMYATFKNGTLIERVAGKANGSTINAQDADEINISLYDTQSSDITGGSVVTNVQLEVGSSVSSFSPYVSPTQYTVSLGRTIHGGSLEFINGAGTDENDVNFTFDPISPIPETENVCNFWTNVGASSIVYRRDIDLALQALSGNRGLMMFSRAAEPMIGEESDLEQVNELEVEPEITEEQEGGNDAR